MVSTKIKFTSAGMVTSYVVEDAEGRRIELKDGDIVNLEVGNAKKLVKEFPKSFAFHSDEPQQEEKQGEGDQGEAGGGSEGGSAGSENDPDDAPDLASLNKVELIAFCKVNGIEIPNADKLKKDELIEAITKALKPPSENKMHGGPAENK